MTAMLLADVLVVAGSEIFDGPGLRVLLPMRSRLYCKNHRFWHSKSFYSDLCFAISQAAEQATGLCVVLALRKLNFILSAGLRTFAYTVFDSFCLQRRWLPKKS